MSLEFVIAYYIICVTVSFSIAYEYDIRWYDGMPVDHFNSGDQRTFRMRYIINDKLWSNGDPIFFYCGNEADILLLVENTGFMWDIAPEFHAMIVFAEHRYYGETMPFGEESYVSIENRGYLSSGQVLADYAKFLRWLKEVEYKSPSSPVVAFGGSYGGMLAAWLRMKYPNVVVGSLASSAPIWQLAGITPCWKFAEIATRTFANSGVGCDKVIRRSWNALRSIAFKIDGNEKLNKIFRLCENSKLLNFDDVWILMGWLNNGWGYLAMFDYPYPANVLKRLPAWPVKVSCEKMTNPYGTPEDIAQQLFQGISVYQNWTGQAECFDIKSSSNRAADADGWEYQICTEFFMSFCSNGTDMFDPSPWDMNGWSDYCFSKFRVRPLLNGEISLATKIRTASNIIFSNGDLDPFSGGGVTTPVKGADASLVVLYIEKSAHHLDLRSLNSAADPDEIKQARETEKSVIRCWIANPTKKCGIHGVIDDETISIAGSSLVFPIAIDIIALLYLIGFWYIFVA